MPIPRRPLVTPSLLLALALPLAAQSPSPVSVAEAAAWRADLRVLAEELPRRHPMPFAGRTPAKLTQARFDSAVRALDARIPTLPRHRIVVELERIVALVGDGHTSINPFYDRAAGFRYYPLELHVFADGMYVRRAAPPHDSLAGARVIRLGTMSAEDALRAVGGVVSHENEQFLRAFGPGYLMIPEIAEALGIAPDMERLALELEKDGRRFTALVAPAGAMRPAGHDGVGAVDTRGWRDMRPAGTTAPLYQSRDEPRWMHYLPAARTLYVAYQSAVPPQHGGEPVAAFMDRVLAAARGDSVERLILDVRGNTGGESFYNRQLVLGIVRNTRLDQRGRLFVVTGRRTYSAAMNLVNELERWTNATFVGEPTGSPPAFFGDHRPLVLPNSRIAVNVSSLWWQTMNPRDVRPWLAPQVYAEESAADHRAGRDPAVEAILRRAERPTLAALLLDPLARGDTALAWSRLAAYVADPENRYLGVEAEVNALGYERLRAGDAARAIGLFALNVRAFPRSANVYDSLADAYERAGRKAEAVAMYERALAIDPGYASSRDGLRRLTAPH